MKTDDALKLPTLQCYHTQIVQKFFIYREGSRYKASQHRINKTDVSVAFKDTDISEAHITSEQRHLKRNVTSIRPCCNLINKTNKSEPSKDANISEDQLTFQLSRIYT